MNHHWGKEAREAEKAARETLFRMPKTDWRSRSPGASPQIVIALFVLMLLTECAQKIHDVVSPLLRP